jgi:AAA+ ATPase superfamily predicted ATPase
MRVNPFRPGGIVSPGMFCGRLEEIETIEQCLHQTKFGNPQHFLIDGERGIGKSSLMLCASVLAQSEEEKTNFLVLELELRSDTTYLELIKKIGSSFRHELRDRANLKHLAKTAWDFVSKWRVLGIEYKGEHQGIAAIEEAIDELVFGFTSFIKESGDSIDGILILIDEADKADPLNCNLGEFVKLFTEKLTKKGCDKVCLGLAGLPVLLQKLREGHESSLRVFESLSLKPLQEHETEQVISRGLEEAKKKNGVETLISDEAIKFLVHISDGYPHFIQQFAFSAFAHDRDDHIDEEDATNGAYKENGALDQLGRKYFQELYFDKIASQDYRKVLDTMADAGDAWVQRKELVERSGALKGRAIILSNPERQGEYRLPTKSFAVWIKALCLKRDFSDVKGL